ncbi:hypothetical protein ACI2K6_09050 [Microbacterium sp. NPDC006705]|uniref:hypothetical protein n=1 Tax=Microbacterium sp. NPDC006705 TaxID=3364181 RepID=UPI0038514677
MNNTSRTLGDALRYWAYEAPTPEPIPYFQGGMDPKHQDMAELLWSPVAKTRVIIERTDGVETGYMSVTTREGSDEVVLRHSSIEDFPQAMWKLFLYPHLTGVDLSPDVMLLHRCDAPLCVHVDVDPAASHLRVGDASANQDDAARAGRHRNRFTSERASDSTRAPAPIASPVLDVCWTRCATSTSTCAASTPGIRSNTPARRRQEKALRSRGTRT